MTNADMFRAVFNGLMATELWAKPESEFLEWLNAEAIPNETFRQEPQPQDVMSPDEFKNGLLEMFSSIWDCEIDHPAFQDTVGEMMSDVMQLYARAVKWK